MQNNSLTKRLQVFNAQLEEKVTLRTSDLVHKSEALSQKQQNSNHYMNITLILFLQLI